MKFSIFNKLKKAAFITATAVVGLLSAVASPDAMAHGERAQEPFLRMRSIQWYDMQWSKDTVKVNDEMILSGKFRVFPDWPNALQEPKVSFLNIGIPGPVFLRTSTEIGDEVQFFSGPLEIGKDYSFKVTVKARKPGEYHMHSQLNMLGNGPVAGPGSWVKIVGDEKDFSSPITTLTGRTVDTMTVGKAEGITWHIIWAVLGAAWLLYWLTQPLFLARFRALNNGREDVLVTSGHMKLGVAVLVVSLGLIFYGYQSATAKYPNVVPLQTGKAVYNAIDLPASPAVIKVNDASYDVPGRAMRINVTITNKGERPLRIGEFSTAGVRFLNAESGIPLDNPAYPKEMLALQGLKLDNNAPIQPGETRKMTITAADAIWELQRLVDLVNDPDSRFGGMLYFYDDAGRRDIASISGTVVPVFTALKL